VSDIYKIAPIARIRTDFPSKFGIPRQSGMVPELCGTIVFEPEYRRPEAIRGIGDFSHLWLIWGFSESRREAWSTTVRPPRLGGNKRVGVFATRSPFRPNGLGLSCVKHEGVNLSAEGWPILVVSGVDMLDGTPIYDIKPYIPTADLKPDTSEGYTAETKLHSLEVCFDGDLEEAVPAELRSPLRGILENDPRPGYDDTPDKRYGLEFADMDVGFTVDGDRLTVVRVDRK